MEDVLEEVVSSDDLKKFERIYNEQLRSAHVTQKAQFEYAWCLVRSKYPADIRKGIMLLEDLYCNHSDSEKRDCLYYLAIGNARIKEYTKALAYVRSFLQVEPGNDQVQHLEMLIKKKMEKVQSYLGSCFIKKYKKNGFDSSKKWKNKRTTRRIVNKYTYYCDCKFPSFSTFK
ncbi:mitochondrial fission 1 protein isoform X1 [Ceratina calcarata]|uniref:Mitochondrial fission 1 protein isoform X1 n=1 Tax=Ceratina calcarata TaxID=156304 RepID=A0AAJ7W7V9_9HYME|nr:mitochondrial fission 1 protein isoform X1 [Ceratina calcarata]